MPYDSQSKLGPYIYFDSYDLFKCKKRPIAQQWAVDDTDNVYEKKTRPGAELALFTRKFNNRQFHAVTM